MTDLRGALDQASVPTLLLCLAHVTGDPRWFEERYRPRRDTNLFADESGGLEPEVQEEIKAAVVEMVARAGSGDLVVPPPPDEATMVELMRLCVAEEVPPEYAANALEDLGLQDRDVHWTSGRPAAADALRVLIVGAGVSGLAAAVKLDGLGIDFEIVERDPGLGGTWFRNRYPESGVDTPNHFYSYSFAPNPGWSGYFSKQHEVLSYLEGVADRYGLHDRLSLCTEVLSMRWDEDELRWEVRLRDPDGAERTERPDVVITATGQMNRPKILPADIGDFDGPWFHSAEWPEDDSMIDGARVAVVGTGASAMQLLRTVADRAEHVTVFQRSPQWVRPSPDYHREVAPGTQWLMEHVPGYAAWYRFGLFWRFGDGLLRTLRRDPEWPDPARSLNRQNDRHRQQMTEYLLEELDGRPDLVEVCLPDYPPYGKRILVDNHWYATVRRDDVTLFPEGIASVDGRTLVATDGSRHDVDVVILATGFESGKLLHPIEIVGRSGTPLAETWADDDPRAYLGITVPDHPNLFCLYGPNTNLGHGGSVMFQAECQSRYVTDCLRQMLESGIAAIECRRDVHDDYNARVDAEHEQLVWTHPGMDTWYRNAKGRVFSVMPWRLVDYWRMTHDADLTDYLTSTRET